MDELDRAIDLLEGQNRLASALQVTYQAIQRWRKNGVVPPDRCRDIEAVTDGRCRCERLRADLRWTRDARGGVSGYYTPLPESTAEAA